MVDLGQIAYEAYGEAREWRTHDGGTMPSWGQQSEGLRAAWWAAADAVIDALAAQAEARKEGR